MKTPEAQTQNHTRLLLISFTFILACFFNTTQGQQLTSDWNYFELDENIGTTGMFAVDLNQDGQKEILVGYRDYFSVVSFDGNKYEVSWSSKLYDLEISHPVGVRVVENAFSLAPKIYVLLGNATVDIYDGTALQLEQTIDLNYAPPQGDLPAFRNFEIVDLDRDGQNEMVILADKELRVYDLQSWQLKNARSFDNAVYMKIANVDMDSALEIIFSEYTQSQGHTGYIIDGVTFQDEWVNSVPYIRGFAIGDINGDSLPEIVVPYTTEDSVKAFDPRSKTRIWSKKENGLDYYLELLQSPGNSMPLLVIPHSSFFNIYDPSDFTLIDQWSLDNTLGGVHTIGGQHRSILMEDIDQDGDEEYIISVGRGTSPDHLMIIDKDTKTTEWGNLDQTGPFYVNMGDIDGDSLPDLVVNSFESTCIFQPNQSANTTENSTIKVYDPFTHQLKRDIFFFLGTHYESERVYDSKLVNVDADPEMEMIIGTQSALKVFDFTTDSLIIEKHFPPGDYYRTLAIGDLEGDGLEEIVMLDREGDLKVFNSADLSEKWNLTNLFGSHDFLKLAQLDADSAMEIVITGFNLVRVFDGVTQMLEYQETVNFQGPGRVVIADMNQDGNQDIVIKDRKHNFAVVTTQPYAISYYPTNITGLEILGWEHSDFGVGDLDQNPDPEIIVQTDRLYVLGYPGFQIISQTGHSFQVEYFDRYGEMIVNDFDNDGMKDIWVTGQRGIFHFKNGPLWATPLESELEASEEDIRIKTFPNPFEKTFSIEIEVSNSLPVHFKLYNLSGQILWEHGSEILDKGTHKISVEDLALPLGLYLLHYRTPTHQGSTRIIAN